MLGEQTFVFTIVAISLFLIIAILALIYSLPILCIRRFQHRNNIFALNVCLTIIITCLVNAASIVSPLVGSPYQEFMATHPAAIVNLFDGI